ncbi:hypothetical protein MLD38_035630 [Melastoma candidum]|uniref:Uncharacterized protein n=1 Tax=Melastoma candidum TaxID=119954 RepID=A0ACB9LHF4_9MYRT|nr:hypothetical protein MLD38_035630 [Melastoma candidum]
MDHQQTAVTEKPAAATVQHVSRKCSDQLLSKFADPTGEADSLARKGLMIRLPSRRPRRVRPADRASEGERGESPSRRWSGGSFPERRLLLPPSAKKKRSRFVGGMVGSSARKRSVMAAIEETWRRTVEGASRVFVERHYNRHKRLISDAAA